ncbi:MAG: hypothetical protein WKF75_06195 [Singulisphaera sp.]
MQAGLPSGSIRLRATSKGRARALMGEARDSSARGREADDARLRIALLEFRFQEGLPIREIARRWGTDPARLHREYRGHAGSSGGSPGGRGRPSSRHARRRRTHLRPLILSLQP